MLSDDDFSEFVNVKIKDAKFLRDLIDETINLRKCSKASFFRVKRSSTNMSKEDSVKSKKSPRRNDSRKRSRNRGRVGIS